MLHQLLLMGEGVGVCGVSLRLTLPIAAQQVLAAGSLLHLLGKEQQAAPLEAILVALAVEQAGAILVEAAPVEAILVAVAAAAVPLVVVHLAMEAAVADLPTNRQPLLPIPSLPNLVLEDFLKTPMDATSRGLQEFPTRHSRESYAKKRSMPEEVR